MKDGEKQSVMNDTVWNRSVPRMVTAEGKQKGMRKC